MSAYVVDREHVDLLVRLILEGPADVPVSINWRICASSRDLAVRPVEIRKRRRRDRGQALVEFALLTAVFLPLALAATQVVMLLTYRITQVQATGTLASVAAVDGPGAAFADALASEAARIDCEAPAAVVSTPEPMVVVVDLRCTWRAPVYADASWPVSTSASAFLEPSPTPSPDPSPSGAIGEPLVGLVP